jgi:hypothetical protein
MGNNRDIDASVDSRKIWRKNMENASGTKASGSGWVAVDVGGVGHRWKEEMETHRMVVILSELDRY